MKKIILAAALMLTAFTQAQVITAFNGEEEITEGYVYTTTTIDVGNPDKLDILVTNVSAATINLKLKITNLTNADGNSFKLQFCFGTDCFFQVVEGSKVPSAVAGLALAPGEQNTDADHFYSVYAGDVPGQPVIYDIAIIQINPDGTEVATLRNFQYKYDPTAGLNDFSSLQKMGISLNSTVVKNTMDITATQNASMELFNINGQSVKSAAITNGSQSVDLSGLAAAVYIARFTNEEKKTSQIRIVKN